MDDLYDICICTNCYYSSCKRVFFFFFLILVYFDFVSNKDVKHIPSTNLIDCKYWAHKNPRIESNGVTDYSKSPAQLSSTDVDEFEEIGFPQEEYEDDSFNQKESTPNTGEELFGNVRHDVTNNGTPAWTGAVCSPFHSRRNYYTCTITMKSNVWPGAYAVACKKYVYTHKYNI